MAKKVAHGELSLDKAVKQIEPKPEMPKAKDPENEDIQHAAEDTVSTACAPKKTFGRTTVCGETVSVVEIGVVPCIPLVTAMPSLKLVCSVMSTPPMRESMMSDSGERSAR